MSALEVSAHPHLLYTTSHSQIIWEWVQVLDHMLARIPSLHHRDGLLLSSSIKYCGGEGGV